MRKVPGSFALSFPMVFDKITIIVFFQHAAITISFYDALRICLSDESTDGITFFVGRITTSLLP
ncbi:MAG: hypothetical protein ACXVMI_11535 [Flavisolibacter sp.]